MNQWPLLKSHRPPGWTEFVCQYCGAGVQLWINADWCQLSSKEHHIRTDELRCSVSFCNFGNGCFSILAGGFHSVFMGK